MTQQFKECIHVDSKNSIDYFVGMPYYTTRIWNQKNLPVIRIKKRYVYLAHIPFIHLSSYMLVVSAKKARKVYTAEIEK